MTHQEFTDYGDQLFNRLASRFPHAHKFRLLVTQPLSWQRLEAIRFAALGYVSACLGRPVRDERELGMELGKANFANMTPNGLLVPKREFVLEFNVFQRAVAGIFEDFDLCGLAAAVHVPASLRLVTGLEDSARDKRPRATGKLHSDVWAGEPVDAVVVHIPLFGDPENIGIQFQEMQRDQELAFMRVLEDYEEGAGLGTVHYGCQFRSGNIYFADARLLHATVRNRGGFRLSVDFRFRLPSDGQYKAMSDAILTNGRSDNYMAYDQFRKFTSRSLMVFDNTVKEGPVTKYAADFRTLDY